MSYLDSSFRLFFCSTDQVGGQRNKIWRVRGQTRRIIMRLSGTMERYGECQMRMKPIIGEIRETRVWLVAQLVGMVNCGTTVVAALCCRDP